MSWPLPATVSDPEPEIVPASAEVPVPLLPPQDVQTYEGKQIKICTASPEIIPVSTIDKPPSAELKPNQVDQDTLPPYEILDEILKLYVEENLSARDIVARGFEEQMVRWVQRRVDLNEYKREQAQAQQQQ